MNHNFLPTTPEELTKSSWDWLDVILISGDSYIDSPFIGAAVIGRILDSAGFRVGIIAQPDIHASGDITRLGEPRLFWGVTGGSVDSMVANHTASRKKQHMAYFLCFKFAPLNKDTTIKPDYQETSAHLYGGNIETPVFLMVRFPCEESIAFLECPGYIFSNEKSPVFGVASPDVPGQPVF